MTRVIKKLNTTVKRLIKDPRLTIADFSTGKTFSMLTTTDDKKPLKHTITLTSTVATARLNGALKNKTLNFPNKKNITT